MKPTPYILHYAPDNASLVIRLALEELGQPYEVALVDRRIAAQKSERYLALNPNGLIPVLETQDGPIFETAAILLWLTDRHGALGPPVLSPERADFLKWLFFLSNTLHPSLRRLFYADKYVGGQPAMQEQLRAITRLHIKQHLSVVNRRWASDVPVARALDLYIAPMLRWLVLYPANSDYSWYTLESYPALHAIATNLEKSPALRAVSRAEGLGPHPITHPRSPNPPEGSAT